MCRDSISEPNGLSHCLGPALSLRQSILVSFVAARQRRSSSHPVSIFIFQLVILETGGGGGGGLGVGGGGGGGGARWSV